MVNCYIIVKVIVLVDFSGPRKGRMQQFREGAGLNVRPHSQDWHSGDSVKSWKF
jgi:hypothetical protein